MMKELTSSQGVSTKKQSENILSRCEQGSILLGYVLLSDKRHECLLPAARRAFQLITTVREACQCLRGKLSFETDSAKMMLYCVSE